MADSKISALTDGGGLQAGDALAIARSSTSFRASPIGVPVLVYRYTVAGSDKASIDTGVDTRDAGSGDWTNGDVLEVWITASTDDTGANHNIDITVNNDTSSIYDQQTVIGNNATASANNQVAAAHWNPLVHSTGAGSTSYPGAVAFTIPDYAGTTFWKSGEMRGSVNDATAANQFSILYSLGYRSTSAITRMKVTAESTNKLKVGSQLLIYKRLSS